MFGVVCVVAVACCGLLGGGGGVMHSDECGGSSVRGWGVPGGVLSGCVLPGGGVPASELRSRSTGQRKQCIYDAPFPE